MVSIRQVTRKILPIAAVTLLTAAYANTNQSKIQEPAQNISNAHQKGEDKNIPSLPLTAPTVLAAMGIAACKNKYSEINTPDEDGYTPLHRAFMNLEEKLTNKNQEADIETEFKNILNMINNSDFDVTVRARKLRYSYINYALEIANEISETQRTQLLNALTKRIMSNPDYNPQELNNLDETDIMQLVRCGYFETAKELINHENFNPLYRYSHNRTLPQYLTAGGRLIDAEQGKIDEIIELINSKQNLLWEKINKAAGITQNPNFDITKRFGKDEKSYIELIAENKNIKPEDKKKLVSYLTDILVSDKEYNPNATNSKGETDAMIMINNGFVENAIKMIKHPKFSIIPDESNNCIRLSYIRTVLYALIKKEDENILIEELKEKALQNKEYYPHFRYHGSATSVGSSDIVDLILGGYPKVARQLNDAYFDKLVTAVT